MPFFSTMMFAGLVLILCISFSSSIEWLGIAQHRYTWLQSIDCYSARRDGFSFEQSRFCRRYLDLMPHIHGASREIISICMSVFSGHRWNCSSLLFAPNFLVELRFGTIEQAFIQALSSALLMHRFSRICALNQTSRCSCGLTKKRSNETFLTRNSCSDNIEFGLTFSQMFIGREEKYRLTQRRSVPRRSFGYGSFLKAITRHNYALGQQLVIDNFKRKCKCAGLSGSCTIRTCWQAVASPQSLAYQLKNRYKQAIEVIPNFLDDDSLHPLFFPITSRRIRRIHPNDLLYWAQSPDYCQQNNPLFSTHGRRCNNSLINSSEGSCDYLCCGRGYQTKRIIQEVHCHCQYVHCCYLRCDICFEQIEENICE